MLSQYACDSLTPVMDAFFTRFNKDEKVTMNESILFRRIMDSDLISTNSPQVDVCKVKFASIGVGDFSPTSCETDGSAACTSAPREVTYETAKCSSVESLFKRFWLNEVISGCDFECTIKAFNSATDFFYKVLPSVVYKVYLQAESVYFSGLYNSRMVCDSSSAYGGIRNFWELNSTPTVFKVPTAGIDNLFTRGVLRQLSTKFMNMKSRLNARNRVMFVDSDFFDAFINNVEKTQITCCPLQSGILSSGTMQMYTDNISGITIIQVPDYYIAYDEVTHTPIYPIVDVSKYFVTSLGRQPFAGWNNIFGDSFIPYQGRVMSMLIGNTVPMGVELYGNDPHHTAAAYFRYGVTMGEIMKSTEAVYYLLGKPQLDNDKYKSEGRTPVTLPANINTINFPVSVQ